jgi:hypothetical protein
MCPLIVAAVVVVIVVGYTSMVNFVVVFPKEGSVIHNINHC